MLNAVRRGPALARAFRACAPRTLHSAKTTPALVANFRTTFPSASSSASQVRLFQSQPAQKQANATATAEAQDPSKPISDFTDLAVQGLVHPRIIHAITEKMGIKTMTDVQRLTIQNTIQGLDTLAQAKTGTGKTLAFLVPVLQKIITNDPSLLQGHGGRRGPRTHSHDIRAIIVSPTRELAEQIAVEARKVASNTGIVVQTAVGGTRKQEGLARILREGCHILVATPGRLKDILSDHSSRVSAPNLDAFVLDEADRLLDDGFGPEIENIKEFLPDPKLRDRQTLMFSATLPREVMGMVRMSMKPNFEIVNTVAENEVPTHLRVPQKVVFLRGLENGIPAILEILNKYKERTVADPSLRPMKAIVYYNTTAETQLVYEALTQLLNDPADRRSGNPLGRYVFRMHSKLSQGQRTGYSESFRRCRSGILISSDVTARGLDFPDVTHVIQMSIPKTRESYVHRLGRTGRAGKEGEGWILIHDEEDQTFIERLGHLPIQQDESLETANVSIAKKDTLSGPTKTIVDQATAALKLVPFESKEDAYRVQISALSNHFRRKHVFVEVLNSLATHGWGLTQPPSVSESYAHKLGFGRVPGLNLSSNERGSRRGDGRDGNFRNSYGNRNNFAERESRFRRPQRERDSDDFGRFSAGRAGGAGEGRIRFDALSRR